jgi:hypothetical protein
MLNRAAPSGYRGADYGSLPHSKLRLRRLPRAGTYKASVDHDAAPKRTGRSVMDNPPGRLSLGCTTVAILGR